jgi:hypothetical protein
MRSSPATSKKSAGLVITAASALIVLTACGGGGTKPSGGAPADGTESASDELQAAVASYDIAVGPATRFIVGIFNQKRGPVGYGTVPMRFFFLGQGKETGTPKAGPIASASYLPLPGSPPPADASKPVYLSTVERGVYAAEVTFDKVGVWGVEASVDVDGAKTVRTSFEVKPRHEVPAPGDAAPPSQNLTVSSPGARPEAIDSRASATARVPDTDLHQTTVARALSERRPVLLVVSTPTSCETYFCGPVTELVEGLAKDYANRSRFIHIEVWKDHQGKALNDSAQEWIAKGHDVNEPWVFLIGADGKVAARWDNVVTRTEIEPLLQNLAVIRAR